MAQASLNGQMAENMKGNTKIIRRMVKEYIPGLVGENIKVNGKIVESSLTNVALFRLSYGPLRWIVVHRVIKKAFWTGFSFLVYDLY